MSRHRRRQSNQPYKRKSQRDKFNYSKAYRLLRYRGWYLNSPPNTKKDLRDAYKRLKSWTNPDQIPHRKSSIRYQGSIPEASSKNKVVEAFKTGIWAFNNPLQAIVCRRRSDRREALFANKKAGKGISGPKIKNYTNLSKIVCK